MHILIQARMGSKRLPGKSLLPFGNSTLVGYLYSSLIQYGFSKNSVSFVIPDTSDNDDLSHYLSEHNIPFFRGSENDVLSRYIYAAKHIAQETIVRLTADNPLISPELVQCCIKHHNQSQSDVTSTRLIDDNGNLTRFVPKGSSVDIFNKTILNSIEAVNCSNFDKEHVIPAIFRLFPINLVTERELDFCGVDLRTHQIISIDSESDYQEALKCIG